MQENIWEKEYRDPTLVTLSDVPAKCIKDFVRFLRKEKNFNFDNIKVLDLGCGNGKNSLYIKEQGDNIKVTGLEISDTVIGHARRLIPDGNFIKQSIGNTWPVEDSSFDIILDVTASNSLNEDERKVYLGEIKRVLKPNGYFFLRALCKDGDKNAQTLLKTNPGKEKDTYIMPGLGLTERVFSQNDLNANYSHLGDLAYLEKETHYTKYNGRSYKRNFWVGVWVAN